MLVLLHTNHKLSNSSIKVMIHDICQDHALTHRRLLAHKGDPLLRLWKHFKIK